MMKDSPFKKLSDPREMRKFLRELSCGWTDGRSVMTAGVIRQVEIRARREGLSGEDEMTLLAYVALGLLEEQYGRELERVMCMSAPRMIVVPAGDQIIPPNA